VTRQFLRVTGPEQLRAFLQAFYAQGNGRMIVSPPEEGDQTAFLAFDVGDPATYYRLEAALSAQRVGWIPVSPVPTSLLARHPNAFFLVTADCYAQAKIQGLRAAATLSIAVARPSAHQIDRIVEGLWASMSGRPAGTDVMLESCRIG